MKPVSFGHENFISAFYHTVVEGNGSSSGKSVINLSKGEVPEPSETRNDILLDSDGKH